jgi:probable DNA metabolism protein
MVPENFQYYLSMHSDFSNQQLCRAEKLTAIDLELSSSPDAIHYRKMVRSVLAEIYRMRGFVRLEPIGENVLYGYLKPKHKTGREICSYFARKFSNTLIVLGNHYQSWISLCANNDLMNAEGNGLEQTIDELKRIYADSKNSDDIRSIWNVYYSSQYISERRNILAFHRRMPKHSMKGVNLEIEHNKNGLKLDDFFNRPNQKNKKITEE